MAFGDIPEVPVGTLFDNRRALYDGGVHRQLQAGIAGGEHAGAESIVVSGGYEDDEDSGDVIVYTGQGGNDPNTGKQVADQQLTLGNAGLMKSRVEGLPVRVIRRAHPGSPFAPQTGFRYDGLYYVEDAHHVIGKSGFKIWRFTLRRQDATPAPWAPSTAPSPPALAAAAAPGLKQVTVLRVIRNTAMAREVKAIHDYTCQMCGLRLGTPVGPYAEGAHIRPLGAPHRGPDTLDNLLCLCPNHHLLLDVGAITIADDLTLIGTPGKLRTLTKHRISLEYVRYHRSHYAPEG
jgi:putative restriction endonuclease